jgi:hypothetical protein
MGFIRKTLKAPVQAAKWAAFPVPMAVTHGSRKARNDQTKLLKELVKQGKQK